MSQMLKKDQELRAEHSGAVCRVEQYLDGGGQGEVYRADMGGQPVAVKWYYPSAASADQRRRLAELIRCGPPNPTFLWPVEMLSANAIEGFGYVMPLRPSNYKSTSDLLRRRIDPTFRVLSMAGLRLVSGFLQLHSKGLCYRDISSENIFFDPATGDVLICDNDNVGVEGESFSGVCGTPRFMAPEIVRREQWPSIQTDLFSLAVLLFYLFMTHHPLEGRKELEIHCLDSQAMVKLYGEAPVFIFDPSDTSNRPTTGVQDNALQSWPIYPEFLRTLFIKAFTSGLKDPANGRVREGEWRVALARLMDAILYCPFCGRELFYDLARVEKGARHKCWGPNCSREVSLPPRLRIDDSVIMLNHDSKLFPYHLDDARLYDYSDAIAAVVRHPSTPGRWGLNNLSKEKWVVTLPSGELRDVLPGQTAALAGGVKISFGRRVGEVAS